MSPDNKKLAPCPKTFLEPLIYRKGRGEREGPTNSSERWGYQNLLVKWREEEERTSDQCHSLPMCHRANQGVSVKIFNRKNSRKFSGFLQILDIEFRTTA